MRRYLNQNTVTPTKGVEFKLRSVTQLAEYQPLQKQLANLTIAGLNAAAKQALEFYDSEVPDGVDIPLLPRHISPDITEVTEVSRIFQEQKLMIEKRVREEREKNIQKLRLDAKRRSESPPPGAPGAGGGVSAPVAPEGAK